MLSYFILQLSVGILCPLPNPTSSPTWIPYRSLAVADILAADFILASLQLFSSEGHLGHLLCNSEFRLTVPQKCFIVKAKVKVGMTFSDVCLFQQNLE